MQLMVTGRNMEITDSLKAHIEKKLRKIKKYFDRIIDVHVVLSVEKYRQSAEVTISGGDGINYHSQETTDDVYVSVDKAIEKIERQLRRRRTKVRGAKKQKAGEVREAKRQIPVEQFDVEEPIPAAGTAGRAGAPEQAANEGPPAEQHGPFRVQISTKFAPKPMSIEEALMQLDSSDDDFLGFVEATTDDVHVVFKRTEGGFGLLRRPF
ncbi:MAG: ribosome-associated translation inhibitor RaiA [Candidatus Abyssubacteria bacterium]